MWTHVAYTRTGTTGVLYQDGVKAARNTAVTITPGSVGSGVTTADCIGKSLCSGAKFFKGKMCDFRVYNRALAPGEVLESPGRPRGVQPPTRPWLRPAVQHRYLRLRTRDGD
ncbi:LamG domain-containing protein [Streptomyces sp. NPDC003011]